MRTRPVIIHAAILTAVWAAAAISVVGAFQCALAAPTVVDDTKAQTLGIRKLVGQHLVLYTDLPASPGIDSLPAVFDQAVPQWAEYFGVNLAKTHDWQARAFLIGDRKAFDKLGVMPAGDDQFLHALAAGSEFWMYDQPTAYYRRHLLLHEGTHAFMGKFLGGCGPGWYMEGTAELFGTHRFVAKKESTPRDGVAYSDPTRNSSETVPSVTVELQTRIMPQGREEVPMWGRTKLIRDAMAAGRMLDLPAVMALDNHKQMDDESYAWCWAATKFLDSDPRYRDRFRGLKQHVTDKDFNEVVRREYGKDWQAIEAEWPAYIVALDYGYDFERMAIDLQRGTPLDGKPRSVTIAADRGWQTSGVWLEAGKTYHVSATGRYQIAMEKTSDGEKAWPCEPGGVTIDYQDGRPLGMLLGAVVEGARSEERGAMEEGGKNVGAKTGSDVTGFARPFGIGLGCTITPEVSGTLYLRVNDSAARLDDNRGTLTIRVDD